MRIGIYTPYLDTLGGGEKYILYAAQCLSKEHEVSVFWDGPDLLTSAERKFNLDLSRVQLTKNIFSKEVGLKDRFMMSRRFDKILFLSDGSIPIVSSKLYVHFQFPVEWVKIRSLTDKLKVKRISKVICNSNFTKSYIDKKINVKSDVLYPPCFVETQVSKKENIILNVGRLAFLESGESFKKQEFLIKAFEKMSKEGLDNWKLVLVVNINSRDREKAKHILSKASSKIEIIENPGFTDLIKIYSKSKIYWHASGYSEDLDKYPERAEHFGISTVEAMAQGSIPVVINKGGQKEIVDEGKNGFLWESEEELIQKTMDVISGKVDMENLSRSAISKSQMFSEDEFCNKLTEIMS